jgi:hypothetical protein
MKSTRSPSVGDVFRLRQARSEVAHEPAAWTKVDASAISEEVDRGAGTDLQIGAVRYWDQFVVQTQHKRGFKK